MFIYDSLFSTLFLSEAEFYLFYAEGVLFLFFDVDLLLLLLLLWLFDFSETDDWEKSLLYIL